MNTSNQGIRALMKSENFEPEAYLDGGGVWTIGYGTIRLDGAPVRRGQRITPERAEKELRNFVAGLETALNAALGKTPTTQAEFDAFINLGYNIGLGRPAYNGKAKISGLLTSTALARHIAGDKNGAAEAITWWNKDNGKVVRGLVNRRAREVEMYRHGVYVM